MTDSRVIGFAVGGSFAFHFIGLALAVLLLAGSGLLAPPGERPADPAEPEPITMLTPDMILVEEKASPPPPAEAERGRDGFVDTAVLREERHPDRDARFEGDRNTRAGSDSEPNPETSGPADLPWQKGANIASIHIVEATPSASAPVIGEGDARVAAPDKTGSQTAAAGDESPRTTLKGSAPKREEVAVTAVETPRARYQGEVTAALKASKNKVVGRIGLPVGTVTVHFHITRDGRQEDPRFLSPPDDRRIGAAALSAVLEAEFPPIPRELFEDLPDGRLPITFEFISY